MCMGSNTSRSLRCTQQRIVTQEGQPDRLLKTVALFQFTYDGLFFGTYYTTYIPLESLWLYITLPLLGLQIKLDVITTFTKAYYDTQLYSRIENTLVKFEHEESTILFRRVTWPKPWQP